MNVDHPLEGVARITIDRPPVNALDHAAFVTLGTILRGLTGDDGVRCVILTAAGERTFSAGTDLAEFQDAASTTRVSVAALAAFEALAGLPQPVIGALNGPAVGVGAMLASQLDLLVAHRGVRFVLPEVPAGFPGGGSHLVRLAPWFKLQRMVLLAEPLTADEASAHGSLAASVDTTDQVHRAAIELAQRVAALEANAVRSARAVVRSAGDRAALQGYRNELLALAATLERNRDRT